MWYLYEELPFDPRSQYCEKQRKWRKLERGCGFMHRLSAVYDVKKWKNHLHWFMASSEREGSFQVKDIKSYKKLGQ
jgi:hypothetical protein